MKSFESSGLWYLPADPAKLVAGSLRYSPEEGLLLSLTGSFAEPTGGVETKTYQRIHGVVTQNPYGRMVTLENCIQTAITIGMPGFATETIFAHLGYLGDFLPEESDPRFTSVRVQYSHLGDWFGSTNFTPQWVDPKGQRGLSVHYACPKPVELSLPKLRLRYDRVFGYSSAAHELTMREQTWAIFEDLGGMRLGEVMSSCTYPIQNFFTFATDTPNALEEMAVFLADSTAPEPKTGSPLHVVAQPVFKPAGEIKVRHPHEMLFTFSDIQGVAEETFHRWMAFAEEFRSFCDVFFGIRYAPAKYIDVRLIQIVGAVQLYIQSAKLPGHDASRSFNSAKDRLFDSTPERQREWLAAALPTDSELDFPWHLLTLLREYREVMEPLVTSQTEDFVDQVMVTKTYISRRDPSLRERAAFGKDLHLMIEKLTILLKACILVKIGFAMNQLPELFNRNQQYMYIRSM